jgi:hypothetical protein
MAGMPNGSVTFFSRMSTPNGQVLECKFNKNQLDIPFPNFSDVVDPQSFL